LQLNVSKDPFTTKTRTLAYSCVLVRVQLCIDSNADLYWTFEG